MAKISYNNIKFYKSFGESHQIEFSSKPEVAFIGKSNVGKSSLLNKLCNNKNLAKVSSVPGKTTTINFFDTNAAFLVDLPGYGFAKRSNAELKRWSELINSYFEMDRNFALIVCLLDIRHKPTDLDCQMISYIHQVGLPFMIVLTKADKLSKQKCANAKKQISNYLKLDGRIPMIACSSETGSGINELKQKIDSVI